MNLFVIGYVQQPKDGDDSYPHRYDVFVVAKDLADALESAYMYQSNESDIVHSVMHTSVPPASKLRFTTAVRSELSWKPSARAAVDGEVEHG